MGASIEGCPFAVCKAFGDRRSRGRERALAACAGCALRALSPSQCGPHLFAHPSRLAGASVPPGLGTEGSRGQRENVSPPHDTGIPFARTFYRIPARTRWEQPIRSSRRSARRPEMNLAKTLAVSAVAGMLMGSTVACGGSSPPPASDPSASGGKASCSASGGAAPASSGKSSCSASGGAAAPKY
jgi:hypothetical protein